MCLGCVYAVFNLIAVVFVRFGPTLSPFLIGTNSLFAEHTSDSSTNYNSFLN